MGGSGWDSRRVFEHCLHDYLMKKNMHETAELFRREADLKLDLPIPEGLDVPDGFLHEWWVTFYDVFSGNESNNEESSSRVPPVQVHFPQEMTASMTRQSVLNKETIRNLAPGLNFGDSSLGSVRLGWPSVEADHLPQSVLSLPHQQSPEVPYPKDVTDDLIPQGGAHLTPRGFESCVSKSSQKNESSVEMTELSQLLESSKTEKASSDRRWMMRGAYVYSSKDSITDNKSSDMSVDVEEGISSSSSYGCFLNF